MAACDISKSCLKRLLADFKLITSSNNTEVDAVPDDNNMLIWYFLIVGPDDSDYAGGYYLGKLMHNPEYPMKAPDYMMLTPSGRFEIDKKICMTNTGYHTSDWSPMWNILTILQGFVSIMLDDGEHGISHIKDSKANRRKMAENSMNFNRSLYPDIIKKFTRFIDEDGNPRKRENIIMKEKKEKKKNINPEPNLVVNPEPAPVEIITEPTPVEINTEPTPVEINTEQDKQEVQEEEHIKKPVKRVYKKRQVKQEKHEENPEPAPVEIITKQEDQDQEQVKKPVKRVYKKKQAVEQEKQEDQEQEQEQEQVKKPVKRVYKKKQDKQEQQVADEPVKQEKQEQQPTKRKYVRKAKQE